MNRLLNEEDRKVRQICLPQRMQHVAWELCHQHLSAGHFGNTATAKRMKTRFYFPGMYRKVAEWNQQCNVCVRKQHKIAGQKTVHMDREVGRPLEKCYVDLIGPLEPTQKGNQYILTFEDSFTRWAEAIPIPNKESKTVSQALFDEILSRHGLVEQIHSDMGREFCANIWMEVMQLLGIKWTTTPPYNPRSNRVERFHQTLEAILRTADDFHQKDWDEKLPMALLAYCTSVHSATGKTPFSALYGRQAILPVDMVFGIPDVPCMNLQDASETLQHRLVKSYQTMRTNQRKQTQRIAQQYTGRASKIDVGDRVWYYTPKRTVGETKKLHTSWTGPWVVIQKIAPILVKIKPEFQERPVIVVPLDRLRQYHLVHGSTRAIFTPDDILEDFGDEYAEDLQPVQDAIMPEEVRYGIPICVPEPVE